MAIKHFTLFAMVLGLALSAPSAHATLYMFTQTGFDGGGVVNASFEGTDANSDGLITTSEITAFSLNFSGDSIVADFSQGLADLYILQYIPGTPYLGDEILAGQWEVIGTRWFQSSGFDYYSGMGAGGFGGAVSNLDTGDISYSGELVRRVPAPTIPWLLGAALPGFIGFSRRKQAA